MLLHLYGHLGMKKKTNNFLTKDLTPPFRRNNRSAFNYKPTRYAKTKKLEADYIVYLLDVL